MIASDGSYYKIANGSIDSAGLPSEYQQVEYIEGTGTQWIDTQIKYKENMSFEVQFMELAIPTPATTQNRTHIFGCHNGTNRVKLRRLEPNTLYILYGNNGESRNVVSPVTYSMLNNIYNVYFSPTNIKVKYNDILIHDWDISNDNIKDINDNITLFYHVFDPTNKFIGRFYFVKIYENGSLSLNLIPCYRLSDNEIGMYDTVNGVFYTNQGTGTFIKGPNVYNMYKVICEPTIYNIRGTATADFDFTLKYIDRNNNVTTVTEHAVIDSNGKWDISYSGKYIYEMDSFYLNTNKSKITSFEFTEKLDYLYSFNTQAQQYRGIFFDCTNLTEIKFAQGTTFKSTTRCYNPFTNTKITELDLRDATFENATQIQGFLNSVKNIITVRMDKIKSSVFYADQGFFLSNSLVNLYVPQDSELNNDLVLSYSPLSYDSMIRVSGWLKDLTGLTAKTVTFKADTYNALTAEQKATLQNIIVTQKGWNLATA